MTIKTNCQGAMNSCVGWVLFLFVLATTHQLWLLCLVPAVRKNTMTVNPQCTSTFACFSRSSTPRCAYSGFPGVMIVPFSPWCMRRAASPEIKQGIFGPSTNHSAPDPQSCLPSHPQTNSFASTVRRTHEANSATGRWAECAAEPFGR